MRERQVARKHDRAAIVSFSGHVEHEIDFLAPERQEPNFAMAISFGAITAQLKYSFRRPWARAAASGMINS